MLVKFYVHLNLQENDLKQARAKKKIHAEQEMGEQKEREIEQLQMKIEEMKNEVTSQKASIKQLKIYQKFMDRVLEHTDEVLDCQYVFQAVS